MKKLDTMLVRMISRSKGQYIATLIILITGVAFFSAMSMAAINMEQTKTDYFAKTNFSDLFLQVTEIPAKRAESLTKLPGIAMAEGRLSYDVPMIQGVRTGEEERITVRLVSTMGEEQKQNRLHLVEGRLPAEGRRELALVQQFAHARNIQLGDSIRLQINGVQSDWEVTGIALSPEYIYLMENEQSLIPSPATFGVAWAPEKLFRQLADQGGRFNEITIQYAKDADETIIIDQLEEVLAPYGLKRIVKSKDQLSNSMIGEEIKNLKRTSTSLPLVFLLVAGLILAMMLSRMVKRDRFKIGILKAIGYRNRAVLFHYVKYAASAGLVGGFLGVLLGTALAGVMTRLYLEYFFMPLFGMGFYPGFLVIAMILSCLFCIVAGILGAREVLTIAPAEAMKPETPRSGKRILMEQARGLWRRFSFSQKLILKNIFRNKKRALFVLAGISLTYGMILFTMSMPQVMDDFMDQQFREFQTMDYNINFKRPTSQQALTDLAQLVDAQAVEGKIEYPFELSNGTRKKTVNLIGLEKDTQFYRFQDPARHPVALPPSGLLLSENLARSLDVTRGDSVRIKSFLPGREDTYLVVQGIISQTMGINAYMDQEAMAKLLFEKNAITGAYLDTRDPKADEQLRKATNIASIANAEQLRGAYEQYMVMVLASVGFMAVFAGILGGSIVYNATIVSINERELEFASLRILGFGKQQLFRMVLSENNLIAAAGILAGIPLGFWMLSASSRLFSTDVYTITLRPTWEAGIQSALLTLLFLLLAQAATYRKIDRLDFLQALKNRSS